MKKVFITAIIIASLSYVLSAQDSSISNPLKGYEISLNSCIGNANLQTVTVTFTLQHELPHQRFYVLSNNTKAYVNGNICTWSMTKMGGQKINYAVIPTKTAVSCEVTFRNVLPSSEALKTFFVNVTSANADGGGNRQSGIIEMHDVAITWQ